MALHHGAIGICPPFLSRLVLFGKNLAEAY